MPETTPSFIVEETLARLQHRFLQHTDDSQRPLNMEDMIRLERQQTE